MGSSAVSATAAHRTTAINASVRFTNPPRDEARGSRPRRPPASILVHEARLVRKGLGPALRIARVARQEQQAPAALFDEQRLTPDDGPRGGPLEDGVHRAEPLELPERRPGWRRQHDF